MQGRNGVIQKFLLGTGQIALRLVPEHEKNIDGLVTLTMRDFCQNEEPSFKRHPIILPLNRQMKRGLQKISYDQIVESFSRPVQIVESFSRLPE